jgi:hypothetical protein
VSLGPSKGTFIGVAAAVALVATAVGGVVLSARHAGLRPGAPAAYAPPAAAGSVAPTAASVGPSSPPPVRSSPPAAPAPVRFVTVPAGHPLPSGTQCAAWVRAKPYPETKGANRAANATTGRPIAGPFFTGDDPRADAVVRPRVDGQFTGTTREILRWAACKWGVDEDLVLAQAAVESWWLQGTLGDWTTDPTRCAPGRGLGVDGKPGQCPESFGILQNRYPYEKPAWPSMAASTAFNADLAYAVWRVCFEGYETWLGKGYAAGDAWGCVGRWFSGRWHVPAADPYTTKVRGYLDQRIWETANFQQP